MDVFAKLDKYLQIKILVEYIGKFKYENGKLKAKYILPETLYHLNILYNAIPKPIIIYNEWYECDDDDERDYVIQLRVQKKYSVYLPINSNTGVPTSIYTLVYTDDRLYIENMNDHMSYINSISPNHNEPQYINISGHNDFRLKYMNIRSEIGTKETNLYSILWEIWENNADIDDFEGTEHEEFLNEFNYDNYLEADD